MAAKDYRKLLGFTEPWFSLGIVTEESLALCASAYETGDDKNSEHYRYGAFRWYVQENRPLSEEASAALYELGASDPNPAMGQAMMADVLDLPQCPASLLLKAQNSGIPHLARKSGRRRLLAELKASTLTEELFNRCLAGTDGVIHRYLVEQINLSSQQMQALAAQGANKATRNLAAVRLRRKNHGTK